MAKSPDEIKRGLECCIKDNCKECPYYPLYEVFGCKLARAKDALALIEHLERQNKCLQENKESFEKRMIDLAQRMPHWISVEERLPERGVEVLGTNGTEVEMCTYWPGQQTPWESWTQFRFKPTHWMPMPEPPKK